MIQKLYDKHNDPDVLQHIVDILNDGGIIISHRKDLPPEEPESEEEQPFYHLLRLEQHQRICASGQCHLQADEAQPARSVYVYPEGRQPFA